MSKIYEALMKAQRLRAEQEPTLARPAFQAAEEREALRAELRACQEQLAALAKRLDAVPAVDPAAITDLGRQIASLAAQQERLVAEPRQLVDVAARHFQEEVDRCTAALQSRSAEVAGVAQRLDEIRVGVVPAIETVRLEVDALHRAAAEQWRVLENLGANLGQVVALRADLDTLRERLAAVDEERRLQQRREQQAAEQHQQVSSLAAEATRIAQDTLAKSEQAQQALFDRLAVVEQTQSRSDRHVRDILGALESLPADAVKPGEVEALRAQVAALLEAQERQPALALLQQAVAELQVHSESLRNALGNLQVSVSQQLAMAGEVDSLRQQVASLTEAHTRQQQSFGSIGRVQATADDALRRVAAIEKLQASAVADFGRRIAELRAEGVEFEEAIERRFELLCGIIDSELDSKVQQAIERRFELLCGIIDSEIDSRFNRLAAAHLHEGRASTPAPVEHEPPSPKAPGDNLIRRASSMAGLRKRTP